MSTIQIHEQFLTIANQLSPKLERAIAQVGPIQFSPDQTSPFPERLCRTVVGQQLSIKAATSIWTRIVSSANGPHLMAHLAETPPEALQACGLSAAKTKAIRAIAQIARSGDLDAEKLGEMERGDRHACLTALWGVGPWTADMLSIFYFGDLDIWPDGDVAARKTLTQLTSVRRKTERTAAQFAPYRTYLALYMWRHVDATPD